MPHVHANGVDIEYESIGRQGGPVILLIMGLAAALPAWPDSLCEGLAAKGFRIIRFDNRDIGRSTHLTQLGAPDLRAMIAKLSRANLSRRPILSTTWPPMRRASLRRSGSVGRMSRAPRWAA